MARRFVAVCFGGALAWGLYQHAGRDPHIYYRLFLLLLIPSMVAVTGLPRQWFRSTRLLPFWILTVLLFSGVFLQPTTEGRGLVVLAVGWMGFCLSLVLTREGTSSARTMVIFLVILASAEALGGLIQAIGSQELAKGTFTNRNHFAGLLNMTIPLAVGGLSANYSGSHGRLRSEVLARAWVVLLSCAFMGLGVLLSLSRMGAISLCLTLLFLAALLTMQPSRAPGSKKRKMSARAVWVLLFTTLALGAWIGMEGLIVRFGVIDQIESRRAVVYGDTLNLIAEHPLLGVGPGMYEWRFRPHQTADPGGWWRHAHNDYLETAAEWGIPLALLFWAFVSWRLWRSVRVFFDSRDSWQQGMSLGCAGAIFSILVHSLVDFNLQIAANWIIFCVILGVSWNLDRVSVERPPDAGVALDGPPNRLR